MYAKDQIRILFYSHDGQGLGHVRRNLAVASALIKEDAHADVLLVSGTNEVHRLDIPARTGVWKLPACRKVGDGDYRSKSLDIPWQDLIRLRGALIETAVKRFAPHVLVSDKHPLGVGGELKPALKACRRIGGQAVLGLRDILDDPDQVKQEWKRYRIMKAIERHYAKVLVYGDASVFDTVDAYEFSDAVHAKSVFTGYVLGLPERQIPEPLPPFLERPDDRPIVVATFGGGEDAQSRLDGFIEASSHAGK